MPGLCGFVHEVLVDLALCLVDVRLRLPDVSYGKGSEWQYAVHGSVKHSPGAVFLQALYLWSPLAPVYAEPSCVVQYRFVQYTCAICITA